MRQRDNKNQFTNIEEGKKPIGRTMKKKNSEKQVPAQKNGILKINPGEKWFHLQFNDVSTESEDLDKRKLEEFESDAVSSLEQEAARYEKQWRDRKPGEVSWMKTVAVGGTSSDKIAVLILQIQQSPFHNLKNLDILLSKLDKNNRHETMLAIDFIKDLFLQDLLPDRKLIPLKNRPLSKLDVLSSGNRHLAKKRLMFWYFEEKLKQSFEKFVKQIEKLCHDTVEATRLKAAEILFLLLLNKPEQEQFLLTSLVNKLGDNCAKITSKIVASLLRLLDKHPNMNATIVSEVEKLVYRQNVSLRAQYYGVLFLCQISLRKNNAGDADVASKLLNIYFNLFKLMVGKGLVDNKMLAILLNGTNRAFPFVQKASVNSILNDIDTLYKVVAVGNTSTSLQALLLLLQVLEISEGVNDRFYCALYRKLLETNLESSTRHHALLFHLLYKTLKSDTVDERTAAFVKRLLQISLNATCATFVCAVLMMLSELTNDKPSILKLEKTAQSSFLTTLKTENGDDDEDEEEHFVDVHGADSEAEFEQEDEKKNVNISSSWVHQNNLKNCTRAISKRKNLCYDPEHRNPMFANADATLPYELLLLKNHYHPTVALFAEKILNKERVEYQGDPLQDFTLMRFLDRFVYRNPKKSKQNDKKKESTSLKKRKSYNPWGVKKLPVTSDEYASKTSNEIPVDEQYLHKYMTSYAKASTSKDRESDDDGSSIASDTFEQFLEKFEPGRKAEEEFLVDFSEGLSKPKIKRKRKGGSAEISSDEADEDNDFDDDDVDRRKNFSTRNLAIDNNNAIAAEEFGDILDNVSSEDEKKGKKRKRKSNMKRKKRFKKK